MTEKYIIEVKRKSMEDTGVESLQSQKLNANMPTDTSISRSNILKNSLVFAQTYRIASTAFNFATSNYQNITGDAITQHNISTTLSVIGEATNIIGSFIVGGYVGGVAALVGTGLKYSTQFAQSSIELNKKNYAINEFNERIGKVIAKGGRR